MGIGALAHERDGHSVGNHSAPETTGGGARVGRLRPVGGNVASPEKLERAFRFTGSGFGKRRRASSRSR
jgi:hypothetical protein